MSPLPDGGPAVERRREPRQDLDVPAQLTLIGLTVEGRLVNVSPRGVCFVTTNPHLRVEPSNFVQIAFSIPAGDGEKPVRRAVRVKHVETTEVDGKPARRLGLEMDAAIEM